VKDWHLLIIGFRTVLYSLVKFEDEFWVCIKKNLEHGKDGRTRVKFFLKGLYSVPVCMFFSQWNNWIVTFSKEVSNLIE
jgi:hypothetical protein